MQYVLIIIAVQKKRLASIFFCNSFVLIDDTNSKIQYSGSCSGLIFRPSQANSLKSSGVNPLISLILTGTGTRVPQAAIEPSMQRSPSPRHGGFRVIGRFLLHEDIGVRTRSAEYDVLELPPILHTIDSV